MSSSQECARARRSPSWFSAAVAVVAFGGLLAGCGSTPEGSVGTVRAGEVERPQSTQPGPSRQRQGLTPPFLAGQPITRIGVLLPFSTLAQESQALYDAAELAMFEQNDPSLLLIPRDAASGPAAAAASAESLGRDGVEVILGPLVRDSVLGARDPARRARAPLIAFSNDRTAAGDGAYLLSFQSEEEVSRIIRYAVSRGLTRIAVLSPDTEYGARTDAEARRAARLAGAQIVAAQLYAPTVAGAASGARALAPAALAGAAEAVLIPGDAEAAASAAAAFAQAGLDPSRLRILGLGSWNLANFRQPGLAGAWVAAPDPLARVSFERRFRASYGREPTRLASLAYDAVVAAAAAARSPEGVSRAQLERPQGFRGADGLFRFRPDGTIERALPVFQVQPNGAAAILEAAPSGFPPAGV